MSLLTFAPAEPPRTERASERPAGLVDALRVWRQRTRSRVQLAQMDDRALLDIGLSRAEAAYEANKPFWRA